jgi:hypothetical protein
MIPDRRREQPARLLPRETNIMNHYSNEAAAIAAALMVARLAALRFEPDLDVPMSRVRNYLHARTARLLLVPSIVSDGSDVADVGEVITAFGCDALVGRADGADTTSVRFTVGLHGHRLFWSMPARLWLGAGAPAHFVPNHPDDTVFALFSVGLRGCEVPPWSSDEEREDGFALGADALAALMAGR